MIGFAAERLMGLEVEQPRHHALPVRDLPHRRCAIGFPLRLSVHREIRT